MHSEWNVVPVIISVPVYSVQFTMYTHTHSLTFTFTFTFTVLESSFCSIFFILIHEIEYSTLKKKLIANIINQAKSINSWNFNSVHMNLEIFKKKTEPKITQEIRIFSPLYRFPRVIEDVEEIFFCFGLNFEINYSNRKTLYNSGEVKLI